jgi:acetyltransferase
MRDLKVFFEPKNVALIGATEREVSVGRYIMENLLSGEKKRKIYPVNPNRDKVLGVKCYKSIREIPDNIELAVIAVPAPIVANILEECGSAGIKGAVIVSAGFREIGEEGKKREEELIRIARKYGIKILGPNCMGIIRPSTNFNCTFFRKTPKPGSIAFLSQSGALGAAILEWAIEEDIGFSAFVSLGSMSDISFGDLIEFFGVDPETSSIIIYMESIQDARKFMSAARGFARTKPIIVLKTGKHPESAIVASSHVGAKIGDDLIYDAVFDRAGVVRVEEIEDLFNCATILKGAALPEGPNLAIITNSGGVGVLVVDTLLDRGGRPAKLSQETIDRLDEILPSHWSKANPIDIMDDADIQRFDKSIEVVLEDKNVDGLIVVCTPHGVVTPLDIANIIKKHSKKTKKPIIAVLPGGVDIERARELLLKENVPVYKFPETAVKTYMYMYQYGHSLKALYETPEELGIDHAPPKTHLKILIKKVLSEGRNILMEEEAKRFFSVYGISVVKPHLTRNPEEAAIVATEIGYPVVLKIVSQDLIDIHRSDIGGVILNVQSADQVRKAYNTIIENVKSYMPDIHIDGISVQKMITNFDYEIIISCKKDPIFGAVIMFGMGGDEGKFFKDVGVGLPPLNQVLARRLMEKTKIYGMLQRGFGKKPPVNLRILEEVLVKVSNLVIDFPEIAELHIDPLAVYKDDSIAIDGRIILDRDKESGNYKEYPHLIISPYPTRYVQPWRLKDGKQVLLRPIRPEDEPLEKKLIESLSSDSLRFRFFNLLRDITHEMLVRHCNIDYDREMAIIAEYIDTNGSKRMVGIARLIVEPGGDEGEFALLVADDFQGKGLGRKLTDMIIEAARDKRLKRIYGIVLQENRKMLALAKDMGFRLKKISPDEIKIIMDIDIE